MGTTNKSIFEKSCLNRYFILLIASQFLFGSETGNTDNIYTFTIYLYTMRSWSFSENCTIIDDYYENCKLCNPYKSQIGYRVQIKDFNSCFEDVCDSHTKRFLCSRCCYDKCDHREITYPGMIGKTLNVISLYF